MIVVDTNVMVYLLTGAGPGDEAARLLIRDPQWTAPPILLSELRNVMVGLVRREQLQPQDVAEICQDAEAILGDRVVSVSSSSVLNAAIGGGLSACDAEFVALARQLGVPLVTADRAILQAVPDVAVALEG
jgi:predicted nucleic acid-binding protein